MRCLTKTAPGELRELSVIATGFWFSLNDHPSSLKHGRFQESPTIGTRADHLKIPHDPHHFG